jgi:diacylglycerol kinase family enzyme
MKLLKQNIKHYDIKYKVNGETGEANGSFFFVTNSTRIAGVNNVYEDIKLDDGLFEVLICNIKTKRELVKRINDIQWMNVSDIPNFKYYRTNNFTIDLVVHLLLLGVLMVKS